MEELQKHIIDQHSGRMGRWNPQNSRRLDVDYRFSNSNRGRDESAGGLPGGEPGLARSGRRSRLLCVPVVDVGDANVRDDGGVSVAAGGDLGDSLSLQDVTRRARADRGTVSVPGRRRRWRGTVDIDVPRSQRRVSPAGPRISPSRRGPDGARAPSVSDAVQQVISDTPFPSVESPAIPETRFTETYYYY